MYDFLYVENMTYFFTSESVSSGHPDKICDQVSDLLVDEFLKNDPYARCGIETAATTNKIIIFGEHRTTHPLSKAFIDEKVRKLIKDIGYEQDGFHWEKLEIDQLLHQQSPDIAQGVDENETKPEGAGDQGIMFGYACNETDVYMPSALHYSHQILRRISKFREQHPDSILGPDAKSQVTLQYEDSKPVFVHSVVLSTQHLESASDNDVKNLVLSMIHETLPKEWVRPETKFYINATGRFVIGGPDGDAGLTGRKIIVDTYGGYAPHGGGAFSGKDPTKVDRSAAYMARYIAKNIVAAGLCDRVTIQLSYCIGIASPLSVYIKPEGTINADFKAVQEYIQQSFDLTPKGIRTFLKLNRPIYLKTAAYGHFGRSSTPDGHFSWEELNHVEHFKKFVR